ncbi:MAG: hypothetical protein ABI903_01105 [Actinomycetota bacterium]
MSTRKRESKVRLIGAFVIIVCALVVVAAGVTLGMVSSELKAEHIADTGTTPQGGSLSIGKADANLFNVYGPVGMSRTHSADVMALPSSPSSMTNGPFLRALFSIAAVALGVAAPVMGIGVLFAVIGIGPMKGTRKR